MSKRPGFYPRNVTYSKGKVTLVFLHVCFFLLLLLKNGHNTYPHFSYEILYISNMFLVSLVGALGGEWIWTQNYFIVNSIIKNKFVQPKMGWEYNSCFALTPVNNLKRSCSGWSGDSEPHLFLTPCPILWTLGQHCASLSSGEGRFMLIMCQNKEFRVYLLSYHSVSEQLVNGGKIKYRKEWVSPFNWHHVSVDQN